MAANVQILDQNIGMVSAYAFAVSKGYQGTEEQFASDMANVGINISEIRDAINTFNGETVPAAIAAVIAKGEEQVAAVANKGAEQVSAVNTTGSAQMSAITSKGEQLLTAIETAGGLQIEEIQWEGTTQKSAVTAEGVSQKASVTAEGVSQKASVTAEGETQVTAVNSAGSSQVSAVNTAGAAEVAAIQLKGEETIASIPDDYTTMEHYQELLNDEVPNTVQTYLFEGGSVSTITHTRGNVTIRTDVFTYGDGTITEARTLNSGESLTIVTNLATLETTVTYSE